MDRTLGIFITASRPRFVDQTGRTNPLFRQMIVRSASDLGESSDAPFGVRKIGEADSARQDSIGGEVGAVENMKKLAGKTTAADADRLVQMANCATETQVALGLEPSGHRAPLVATVACRVTRKGRFFSFCGRQSDGCYQKVERTKHFWTSVTQLSFCYANT